MAATNTVGVGQDYATITEAIAASVNGDTIDVYGTITLAGDGQSSATTGVTVDRNLTIQGQGPAATIVQAAATQGTADRRVFTINAGTTVTLKDMTIRYGNCPLAGAIYNLGTLTITNCVIRDNIGTGNVGGMYTRNATVVISATEIIDNSTPGLVGGIYNIGNAAACSLALTDCTISGNSSRTVGGLDNVAAAGGSFTTTLDGCTISDNESVVNTSSDGGGIRAYVVGDNAANAGTMSLVNCTLSGNKARQKGGAIELDSWNAASPLSVSLLNCTIAGNTADNSDDGFERNYTTHPNGLGGGIFDNNLPTLLTVRNCLIADNVSGAASPVPSDLCCRLASAPPFTPQVDYSILEVWDGARITLSGANNLTGQQASLNLAALADNGGPTETRALLAGSVAIDAGTDTGAPAVDQRDYSRLSPCDIGAYEFMPSFNFVIQGQPAEHDAPLPFGYGTTQVVYGTIVTSTVTTPADEAAGTRYACTGWTGNGSVPASGATTVMTCTVTTDSTQVWHWVTEYLLTLTRVTNATPGWKRAGFVYDLFPTNIDGLVFDHWETNGAPAGSTVPLSITMDAPKDVAAMFRSAFVDATSNTTARFVDWFLNKPTGTVFGDLELCNNTDSTKRLTAPFWYVAESNATTYLMHPDGTEPNSGFPYVDITAEVSAALPGVGNGDALLDPGECVIVLDIEFYKRHRLQEVTGFIQAIWADPPGSGMPYSEETADTDGDGIANAREDEYGLDKNNPYDAEDDSDGDSMINRDEAIADTNPQNPASYLDAWMVVAPDGTVALEWIGGSAVTQYIEGAEEIGQWLTLYTNQPPTDTTNRFELDADGPLKFFRIRVTR